MPLTILSDSNVKELLNNITAGDVELFQVSLQQALHEYSTGIREDGSVSNVQPERTVVENGKGNTTLFMPSTSSSGIGVKVVTLATPRDDASDSASDDSDNIAPAPVNIVTTPQGALTLMEPDGRPMGFVNAEELTAFRTALVSSLLLTRRSKVKTLTVFGVGRQAHWHVRLALLLHGNTIKHVHFINRSFSDRANLTMKAFLQFDPAVKEREGWANTAFGMLTPGYGEYHRLIKEQLRVADVIFCTTPSTEPLFDPQILTSTEGRKRGRLIVAVGSYKKHMIELPPEILKQAVHISSGHHFHKHAEEGQVVVVDTLACVTQTGELTQANIKEKQTVEIGELVMLSRMDPNLHAEDSPTLAGSPPESSEMSLESLNIGDAAPGSSLARAFRESTSSPPDTAGNRSGSKSPHRKSSSLWNHRRSGSFTSLTKKKKQTEKEDEMSRWLSRGNVIYKSVGLGLMDLVVGKDLVKLAREKGVGIEVKDF
ncbi:NAD(P)-binding Rossmann-fold containing protein [Venustampulla echinocandica]|uniref:NAD(P)-binding Rossmann-fold containing protein n=1 Tax=Venustampulla echinocandica TaxID=2656787 RepID=A0A370TVD4_9HELO|nr:NAD(P)-binding Rossmann-fold containing protein [Venustampulla echinocandica]RDL39470.1 NAD(P)-binding Rossmann-fold containing protein [Venustampulla echinocandica]